MKGWVVISLLVCVSITAHAQICTLAGKKNDLDFPNIESMSALSYEITVEYTVPNANQTDYYVEFYDISEKSGKVESVQNGVSSTYMYVCETQEAWEINGQNCVLKNLTDTPRMFKDDQTNWIHTATVEDEKIKTTIGPSAMLKIAFDVWDSTERSKKMAYMGIADEPVRGLKAQYWKRCMDDDSTVHYFFSLPSEGDAYNQNKALPLRIIFGGSRQGEDPDLNDQVYDIMNFRPFIPRDLRPFDLPKGKGCRRGEDVDTPVLPSLQDKSLDFSAEVIYRKIYYDGTDAEYWSYYSTLHFALDQLSDLVAYYYTPWTSRKSKEGLEVDPPEFIVYDMNHHYAYKTSIETGECKIIREKKFDPYYLLPLNAGRISLTDPSILFPNSEFQFLSEGVNRGLKVNVFERVIQDFEIDMPDGTPSQIPKAVVTHSYLQDNEIERNEVAVANALTQVQFKLFGREPKVIETLTFNFFSFNTRVDNKRSIFNLKRCFKNDDDYVWVTIGFDIDESELSKIKSQVPDIQNAFESLITSHSILSPSRIPHILVDFTERLYVSVMILGKPPVLLDYNEPQNDMAVVDGAEEDGNEDIEDCATKCLEEKENCWGFSICGAVCKYGTVLAAKPGPEKGCQLYNRYDNETYIPSKEKMVEELRTRIQFKDFEMLVSADDGTNVKVYGSSIEVSEPGEDDRLFHRLGNTLDSRMKVLKTGAKLNGIGKEINDMGKLRYDECQKECLDYKDCETASYCLSDQKCVITSKYGDDLKPEEIKDDNMCNLITRKYEDHFERTPGISLSITAEEILKETSSENCARACLKSSKFNCLSFDHCPVDSDAPCKLHTVHYPNPNTREKVQERSTNCGHYFRKFSTEFKKNPERRTAGSSLPPLTNLTIEECAKNCVEFGKGVCFGFDFCQGSTMRATSCTLLDKPMSNYKTVENKMCVNFIRAETQASPLPYSNGYAGGIGFLCFLIGGIVGALVIFGVAYFRVNRR